MTVSCLVPSLPVSPPAEPLSPGAVRIPINFSWQAASVMRMSASTYPYLRAVVVAVMQSGQFPSPGRRHIPSPGEDDAEAEDEEDCHDGD